MAHAAPRPALKVWLDIGTEEGERQVRETEMLVRQMLRQGWREGCDLRYLATQGAAHGERAWAARFDHVLRLLFPPQAEVSRAVHTGDPPAMR